MTDRKKPDPGEQEQKERAERIRQTIDELKKGRSGPPGAPRKETPREFVERRRRELGHETPEEREPESES